ncbi:ATP synthase F1 subunit gamma [Mangrovibacterium marinum]|uniref:ATP synthase gamma chain n=1 Tax=Mangrovibacterium marinum TaxID=1639118 RepID=A0A2T5C6E7_9BACT|nr:ATP synthase F1 subunit gamma [Mangrovibacterium marinum]PTN10518.1 ATP synthase F1 subcomplex gamma subunit [Mangrovibacterium marinum]
MASLKEIRTRISSVKTTRQVTSAMKMVSAAKLKKAQDAIIHFRPYADKLHGIMQTLSSSLEDMEESVYTLQREPDNVLVVLVTSNRGLCGGFNSSISKIAIEMVEARYSRQLRQKKLSFLTVGKQGEKYLKARNYPVGEQANGLFEDLSYESVSVFAQKLMDDFTSGKYDRIELVYNEFKNAAVQFCRTEQFLPVEQESGNKSVGNQNFIFEPSMEEIVHELIPHSLKIQLFKAFLDSNAAEHGARMTAMHKATDNASELIKELTLTFNKARQTAITNEILEVTNGAEALNG